MHRRVSLLVTIAFVVFGSLAYYGCREASEPGEDDKFAGNLSDPKLLERLGEDDGYTFALFYGGDVHGSLETCG